MSTGVMKAPHYDRYILSYKSVLEAFLVIHRGIFCSWFEDAEELLEKLNIPGVEELLERAICPVTKLHKLSNVFVYYMIAIQIVASLTSDIISNSAKKKISNKRFPPTLSAFILHQRCAIYRILILKNEDILMLLLPPPIGNS